MIVSFEAAQFPRDVMLHGFVSYVRYAVSWCDTGEIVAERGVPVGHAALNRRVVKPALDTGSELRSLCGADRADDLRAPSQINAR